MGPRLKMTLIKIEEGVSDGEVLFHKYGTYSWYWIDTVIARSLMQYITWQYSPFRLRHSKSCSIFSHFALILKPTTQQATCCFSSYSYFKLSLFLKLLVQKTAKEVKALKRKKEETRFVVNIFVLGSLRKDSTFQRRS